MDSPSAYHPSPLQVQVEVHPAAQDEHLLARLRGEFAEMPCLALTGPQAQRLFGLTSAQCERVLGRLVESGVLTVAHGTYRRRTTK